jgi:hypothetical protein
MGTIQLLSGESLIHRRQKFEEDCQIARISFVRHTFTDHLRDCCERIPTASDSARRSCIPPVPSGIAGFPVAPGLVGDQVAHLKWPTQSIVDWCFIIE